mmetsp:Transcript_18692/g.33717  ORF Transcript_18692/g.33717 Transcript_18692/m.33717 type:complete len:88 (+) Transcript_18692:589-852(+)
MVHTSQKTSENQGLRFSGDQKRHQESNVEIKNCHPNGGTKDGLFKITYLLNDTVMIPANDLEVVPSCCRFCILEKYLFTSSMLVPKS